jgi:hypothetical protein
MFCYKYNNRGNSFRNRFSNVRISDVRMFFCSLFDPELSPYHAELVSAPSGVLWTIIRSRQASTPNAFKPTIHPKTATNHGHSFKTAHGLLLVQGPLGNEADTFVVTNTVVDLSPLQHQHFGVGRDGRHDVGVISIVGT